MRNGLGVHPERGPVESERGGGERGEQEGGSQREELRELDRPPPTHLTEVEDLRGARRERKGARDDGADGGDGVPASEDEDQLGCKGRDQDHSPYTDKLDEDIHREGLLELGGENESRRKLGLGPLLVNVER